jgi:membrane protein insertase Oxa1/YidC/SpoIIIJ
MQAKTIANDAMNNKSMKIMEYTMPVMILYFTYIMNAALGLYWIYRSVASIAQTIVLARIFPIPAVTEEDIKLAEQQYGTVKKKKKKKKPAEISSGDEEAETEEMQENDDSDVKENKPRIGKKYTVKRRKSK